MSTSTAERPAPAPLFIGLQSYSEAQAARFFGRDDEIDRLTNLIKANVLTIVFGKSGTGKTSLLNAGVFPRLRKDYCLPFRIRLEFNDDSPDLVSQIKNTLKSEIDKYGFQVESYPGTETLWEYFHREQLWRSVTPILIFDQFEEIFTLTRRSTRFTKADVDQFWQTLSDLVENSIPEELKERVLNDTESIGYSYKVSKIKTVFSFREEFLPEFESITAKMPSLKYSRFRLLPMNGHQAYEVITKTWGAHISKEQAHKIVAFFKSEEEPEQTYDLMNIEPSLLSQVCSLIEKERLHEGSDEISAEFLGRYSKEIILRNIYDEALGEGNIALGAMGTRPLNEFVEDKLITDEGYRTRHALQSADEVLLPGLAVLQAKYFLREEGKSIELTHDVLTPLIKRDREERRRAIAFAAARKKARRRLRLITAAALIVAFGIWFLATQQARHDRALAMKETANAIKELEAKQQELKSVKDSIDSQRKAPLATPVTKVDDALVAGMSTIDSLAQADMQRRFYADSLQLQVLREKLALLKMEAQAKDSSHQVQFNDFTVIKKKADSANKDNRWQISALQRRVTTDSLQLLAAKRNYEALAKIYEKIIFENPDVLPSGNNSPGVPIDPAADTNSLKLALAGSAKSGKAPANLKVYLIPVTAENSAIIRRASTYEIRCDEMNLDKAKGRRLGRFSNGAYVFLDVDPGTYFVKVCTYYGGYYTVTKTQRGNIEFARDVSPPTQ